MRHSFMKKLAAKVKSNPAAFDNFASMINSEEFKQNIKEAAADPTSTQAKEVLSAVLPVLSFGSRSNLLGSIGDTVSISKALAMGTRYGPASTFLTITPDDVSSPNSLRLCYKSIKKTSFPATASDAFFDNLCHNQAFTDEQQTGNISVPLDYSARVKAASGNPVAIALEFQTLIENILTILIGCCPTFQSSNDSKQVRSWYFKENKKGIFGYITAFFGMIETQQRGALHFHVIIGEGYVQIYLKRQVVMEKQHKKCVMKSKKHWTPCT
jgi:hypothetical protein